MSEDNHEHETTCSVDNSDGSDPDDEEATNSGRDKQIPTQELVDDLQRVAEIVDGHVTLSVYREHGEYSAPTFYDRFGDWESALEAADVDVNKEKIRYGRSYANVSKEELLNDVQRVAADLGKTPTRGEYGEHGKYTRGLVDSRFGTWNSCLTAADLEPNRETYDCEVDTHELLTMYYRNGMSVPEITEEVGASEHCISRRIQGSPVSTIRSTAVRRLLYDSPRPAEAVDGMDKRTKRKYGVIVEDGECWIDPNYVCDEDVRSKVERAAEYFGE